MKIMLILASLILSLIFVLFSAMFFDVAAQGIEAARADQVKNAEAISDTLDVTRAPTPTPAPAVERIPSLEEFTSQVRQIGQMGIWAEGQIAFFAYPTDWGVVPGQANMAAYSSDEGYSAFFIHSNFGGTKLYDVAVGTRVAVIHSDRIEWFVIDQSVVFQGTSNGAACGYQEPYFEAGKNNAGVSAKDIVTQYYSKPFAIQTCICDGGIGGVKILTGSRLAYP